MSHKKDSCDTDLSLGLCHFENPDTVDEIRKHSTTNFDHMLPSLGLGPPEKIDQQQASVNLSLSGSKFERVCKEYPIKDIHEVEVERNISARVSDEDEEGSPQKKLRLTKEQSIVLEESFKENSTLNPKHKQALANQLNLRPRQVEVWFQNRRARTKLKQTELDCQLLRKCCERLTHENKRLQKELEALRAMKVSAPIYMELQAANLTVCPSCQRTSEDGEASPKSSISIGSTPCFYVNPSNHPPAAC
ncbi:Leucine zipper, homeobox-associated [Dillenia turbinata]|uniref:Leucine zipper, homeobox-associated n=1 Tax=Dillenia turbinata TaxID=194707 RepID=A0AAN8ZKY5_9MAGN